MEETHKIPIKLKYLLLTVTTSNDKSAKEVMLTNIFLIQCKQLLLFEAGTFVPSSQSDQMFLIPFPQLFPVVLSLNLQMDTNFCISLTAYLSSNQQPTNGELPDHFANYSKQKHFGIRSCMEICHAQLSMQTSLLVTTLA